MFLKMLLTYAVLIMSMSSDKRFYDFEAHRVHVCRIAVQLEFDLPSGTEDTKLEGLC